MPHSVLAEPSAFVRPCSQAGRQQAGRRLGRAACQSGRAAPHASSRARAAAFACSRRPLRCGSGPPRPAPLHSSGSHAAAAAPRAAAAAAAYLEAARALARIGEPLLLGHGHRAVHVAHAGVARVVQRVVRHLVWGGGAGGGVLCVVCCVVCGVCCTVVCCVCGGPRLQLGCVARQPAGPAAFPAAGQPPGCSRACSLRATRTLWCCR
jgi:hypothetical protein